MNKIQEVCGICTEKHCCRGLCREMNNYLINKQKENVNEKYKDLYRNGRRWK